MLRQFYTALVLLGLFSCSDKSARQEVAETPDKVEVSKSSNSQDYLVYPLLYAQTSAEYRALCYQAFELAKIQLAKALKEGAKRPAVVLDLDETVLDNSPYTGWQISTGNPYSPDTWSAWVEDASAEAIPGAIEFLLWANDQDVQLFYVSNRSSDGLAATIKNLNYLGVPQVDSTRILLKTTTSDKSERRARIVAGGVQVVMYIGDNLGDYSEIWDKPAGVLERMENVTARRDEMGVDFIVLPNPLYGTWEGAVYDYDRGISDEQRNSLRRKSLKTWQPTNWK